MKKKIIATVLSLCMASSYALTAHAFSFPQSFWAPNDAFTNAVSTGDHQGIINYGKQLIEIINTCPDAPEKTNIIVDRYTKIAAAYEALGDYENSGNYYKLLYEYASQYGDTYLDYIKGAKAKMAHYIPRMAMYTEGGQDIYYGAKNEHQHGVIFGLCDGENTIDIPEESMILTYQELGNYIRYYNNDAMNEAESRNLAVEYALNCPNEGYDVIDITQKESYLNELSNMFAQHPNVKVFLRFGAEFDVWNNPADPENFKNAFRYVSTYFKQRNPNVAIVWSPNQSSGYYTNVEDYYPGDEYVDWVGMSLYTMPYFLGDKNASMDNKLFFNAGEGSDPVIAVEKIVNLYGDRKPIMISESGCGHKLLSTGEDTTDFAIKRLREELAYLPMVYPQIKIMAYFDHHVPGNDEKYDFRLSNNSALRDTYLTMTKGKHFIHNGEENSEHGAYKKVTSGTTLSGVAPISTYVHEFNKDTDKVAYFMDGNYVGESHEIPYKFDIDTSAYSAGTHELKAVACFTDGTTRQYTEKVNIAAASNDISVVVEGRKLSFDQPPIIHNGRTMVPMRAIFEALGLEVNWYADTQTAAGWNLDKAIQIRIGDDVMYVNENPITLDAPAMIVGGRTLVPARAIAESIGCEVDWDGATRTVNISTK